MSFCYVTLIHLQISMFRHCHAHYHNYPDVWMFLQYFRFVHVKCSFLHSFNLIMLINVTLKFNSIVFKWNNRRCCPFQWHLRMSRNQRIFCFVSHCSILFVLFFQMSIKRVSIVRIEWEFLSFVSRYLLYLFVSLSI